MVNGVSMGAAAQMGEPLRIEMDPFAAGAAGRHVGHPLQAAFREIIHQIVLQTPLILVTGSASTGKTLLVDMTERTCSEKGLSVRRVDRGDLLHLTLGRRSDVLLVDEANAVAESMLEALLPKGGEITATTTVFLGLPSFAHRFAFSDVRPVVIELTPLPESDARSYLLERAASAGLPNLFTTEALDLIIDGSAGSPRLLRSIASLAFFGAASDGASQINLRYAASALVAQGRSGVAKAGETALKLHRADEILIDDQRAIEIPSDTQKAAEGIGRLAFADGMLAEDQKPIPIPSHTQDPAEVVGELACADGVLAEDQKAIEIPSDTQKAPEGIGRLALADGMRTEDQKAIEIPSDTQKAAESIGELACADGVLAEDQKAIQTPSHSQNPAEVVGELACADGVLAEDQKAIQIPSHSQNPAEVVGELACADGLLAEHQKAVESPSDTQEAAESIGGLAHEGAAAADDQNAVETPLHTQKPAESIGEVAYGGGTLGEHRGIPVPSGVQALAESAWKSRGDETPTESRNLGSDREQSNTRQYLSIGLIGRIPRVAAASIVIVAAALAIFTASILAERGPYFAKRLSSTPASVQASTRTLPATSSDEAAKAAQAVPNLRGAEAVILPEKENPNTIEAAAKPVPKATAVNRVARRPLTEEEKAAVSRGLQELGLGELEAAVTRVEPSESQR